MSQSTKPRNRRRKQLSKDAANYATCDRCPGKKFPPHEIAVVAIKGRTLRLCRPCWGRALDKENRAFVKDDRDHRAEAHHDEPAGPVPPPEPPVAGATGLIRCMNVACTAGPLHSGFVPAHYLADAETGLCLECDSELKRDDLLRDQYSRSGRHLTEWAERRPDPRLNRKVERDIDGNVVQWIPAMTLPDMMEKHKAELESIFTGFKDKEKDAVLLYFLTDGATYESVGRQLGRKKSWVGVKVEKFREAIRKAGLPQVLASKTIEMRLRIVEDDKMEGLHYSMRGKYWRHEADTN